MLIFTFTTTWSGLAWPHTLDQICAVSPLPRCWVEPRKCHVRRKLVAGQLRVGSTLLDLDQVVLSTTQHTDTEGKDWIENKNAPMETLPWTVQWTSSQLSDFWKYFHSSLKPTKTFHSGEYEDIKPELGLSCPVLYIGEGAGTKRLKILVSVFVYCRWWRPLASFIFSSLLLRDTIQLSG